MKICFTQTTIGKKIIVALTGVILFGFIMGHILGNLQVFAGAEKINKYAEFLHHSPPILYGTRIVLLISVFFHILYTIQLTRLNKLSRPIPYVEQTVIKANLPSRFMIWSGLFLLAFIIFHLLHLTAGIVHPNFDHENVYQNIVTGFMVVPVAIFYILAMISLGFHLFHGVWSLFQTLGINHPRINCLRRVAATVISVLIPLAYIAIPSAVLLGVLK